MLDHIFRGTKKFCRTKGSLGKSAHTFFFFFPCGELFCKLSKVHGFFSQLHFDNPSHQCGALVSVVLWPQVIHLGQAFLTEQTKTN